MKSFNYRAADDKNNIITGSIFSINRQSAIAELKRRGYFPISVKARLFLYFSMSELMAGSKPLGRKTLHILASRLHAMSDSGLELQKTLTIVTRQSKKDKDLYDIMQQVTFKAGGGVPLAEALTQTRRFPDFFISMIEIGSKSGNLTEVFEELARYYEWEDKSASDVKSALMYPVIVGVLLMGTIITVLAFVIPAYSDIFKSYDVALPFATRFLVGLSRFFAENLRFVFMGCIVFILSAFIFFTRPAGQTLIARMKLNAPLIKNIYQALFNYRFASSARLLLVSGAPALTALEYAFNALDAPHLKKRLNLAVSDIAKGGGIAYSLKKIKYFNDVLISMIETGEETGRLPYMLDKSAKYSRDELEATVRSFSVLVEPIVTIALGIVICLVLMAVVLPSFSLMEAF